jgi:predicted acetyltransferase
MELVWPASRFLAGYVDALERGWNADTGRAAVASQEELARIAADADRFVAEQVMREPSGETVTLPDGSQVPRLPGYRRWLWDGEFCGLIGLRWQAGTQELPPHCLGHIGYAVVPWKRRRGYATAALRQLLPEARVEGLTSSSRPIPTTSRRSVIEANGGVLHERFAAGVVRRHDRPALSDRSRLNRRERTSR